ncbi:MAG: DUF1365 domain-containing protein [Elusimicrobiota bacterium]|nr:MAG: DUF1365 domain-containing protein [Elusimicrobiota bacterium]
MARRALPVPEARLNSALYQGTVRHRRFAPAEHSFTYSMFMVYLDLAEIDEVFRGRLLWSASGPSPARYRRQDHYGDPATPLHESIRALVEEKTGRRPAGPIRLLTNLAYWGWCFNPVSFYYCFDSSGTSVETVVAEVANTPWLERHMYVLDRRECAPGSETMAFRRKKEFHVSPFMDMDQEYAWFFRDPGAALTVHMESFEKGALLFDATMPLRRVEITGASLALALARWPFMTLHVVLGIHWQALRLWLKKVPVYTHPRYREAAR